MRVEGIDAAAGAYRVTIDGAGRTLTGLVPEALLCGTGTSRPSHQSAHEALARHAVHIERALRMLANGDRPRPPYDAVTLIREP